MRTLLELITFVITFRLEDLNYLRKLLNFQRHHLRYIGVCGFIAVRMKELHKMESRTIKYAKF
jgi:hypothetical protein